MRVQPVLGLDVLAREVALGVDESGRKCKTEQDENTGNHCARGLEERRKSILQRPMKIATYNVNGVNGRLPVLLNWLARSKPDVACLQELKSPDERFPIDAIREAGYEAVWHGQKSWNGVAILAREKPQEVRRGCRAIRTTRTAVTSKPWWAA